MREDAREQLSDEEICLGHDESNLDGAMTPPIVQSSLFAQPRFAELLEGLAAEHRHPVYSRGLNPTVAALQRKMAALERGEAAWCFASGMAAISAVFHGLFEQGDHVLFVNQIYGPALQLADHLGRFGVRHDVVLSRDPKAIAAAIRPETRLLYLESPGTMLFRLLPIEAIVGIARERGILTAIDNTWATPIFQKPLSMGVDIVIHSGSKYLGGHSDVVAGVVVTESEIAERIFYDALLLDGGILAPFDAWLVLRGLRTLPVRMRALQEAGLEVARFLEAHPAVERLHHPAFVPEDRELCDRQLRGFSSLFSFTLRDGSFERVERCIDRLRLFRTGVSWGGVESLVISPQRGEQTTCQGIPRGLIRLSVGLEGAEALTRDLGEALPDR